MSESFSLMKHDEMQK